MFGVNFADNNNGWAVGTGGTIIRTTDGGQTWNFQLSNTTNELDDAYFTDASTGTIVGDLGTILRTTDGGQNWIAQASGTTSWLQDVYFTDNNTGTAVGYNGTILRTTNGGQNWVMQNSGTTGALYGVSFTDANTGTAVGDFGTILRTTNGGTDWMPQNSGIWASIFGVSFTSANIGTAAAGYGIIIRTTDGGETWTQQAYFGSAFSGVYFSDQNTGTVVGAAGSIVRTVNGGVPVEMLSFTGSVHGNSIILSWSTATETNNMGFDIERQSTKGRGQSENARWEKIGFAGGSGTTTEKHSYQFIDEDLSPGNYNYRLKQVDFDGSYQYSPVINVNIYTVLKYNLSQNYPNPFNPATRIKYSIPSAGFITLKVYDNLGKEAAVLVNEEKAAGEYTVKFDANELSSGVYFYRLQAGNYSSTKKLIFIK